MSAKAAGDGGVGKGESDGEVQQLDATQPVAPLLGGAHPKPPGLPDVHQQRRGGGGEERIDRGKQRLHVSVAASKQGHGAPTHEAELAEALQPRRHLPDVLAKESSDRHQERYAPAIPYGAANLSTCGGECQRARACLDAAAALRLRCMGRGRCQRRTWKGGTHTTLNELRMKYADPTTKAIAPMSVAIGQSAPSRPVGMGERIVPPQIWID